MNLPEFIAYFRAESDRLIKEQAQHLLEQPAPTFDEYKMHLGRHRGLVDARALFDETVKKAYE